MYNCDDILLIAMNYSNTYVNEFFHCVQYILENINDEDIKESINNKYNDIDYNYDLEEYIVDINRFEYIIISESKVIFKKAIDKRWNIYLDECEIVYKNDKLYLLELGTFTSIQILNTCNAPYDNGEDNLSCMTVSSQYNNNILSYNSASFDTFQNYFNNVKNVLNFATNVEICNSLQIIVSQFEHEFDSYRIEFKKFECKIVKSNNEGVYKEYIDGMWIICTNNFEIKSKNNKVTIIDEFNNVVEKINMNSTDMIN